MAGGSDLTAAQVQAAIEYNQAHHPTTRLAFLRAAFGAGAAVLSNEVFVRFVADWQEANIGAGAGDGKIGPRTEAHLNIMHPKALGATVAARAIQAAGSVLFDSWGNDLREDRKSTRLNSSH